MKGDPTLRSDSGSSLVEMLVAAALAVLAFAMLANDTLPALLLLADAEQSGRHLEIVAAGDVVARAVRAARPDGISPAVSGDEHDLTLVLGQESALRLTLVGGDLVLQVEGVHVDGAPFPSGVLVMGLDLERSGFSLIHDDGRWGSFGGPVAVAFTLAADDVEVARIVALRLRDPLDGSATW